MTNFSANPLASIDVLVGSYGNLGNFLLGTIPGSLGETSALLCIAAFVYLVVRKVIKWQVPVIYVGPVFILTYIIGAFNGYALDLRYPLFGILSGGLMFGAVFMATEPVTTPKTPNGKIIFAFGLGVLTILFRYKSNMPEGVGSAIIVMNLFTVIIDRLAARTRIEPKKSKIALRYGTIALLLIGISSYPIISYANTVTFTPEDVEVASVKQDYVNKNFEYTTYVGNKKVIVIVDLSGKIIEVRDNVYRSEAYLAAYTNEITAFETENYAKYPYLTDVRVEEENTILTIVAHRPTIYGSDVTFIVTLNKKGKIIAFSSNAIAQESYTNPYYPDWSGVHPEDVLPGAIISNQDNLDDIEIVATATQTSLLYFEVARLAIDYANQLIVNGEGK